MNIQGMGSSYYYYGMSPGASGLTMSQGRSGPDAGTIMENDDANQDGYLTLDETPLSEDLFTSADTDSDSQLSTQELEEMLASMPPMMPPGGAGMTQGPPSMGGMEGGMGGAGMGPPPDAESIFDTEDTDSSGTISAEESSLSEELFSELDTDGDGQISMEEMMDGMAQQREEMAGMQGTIPAGQTGLTTSQQDAVSAYQQAMESFMTEYSSGEYTGGGLREFLEIVA